ncbi:hypothetical protein T440DRAFT_533630 [Plenodomus tracheiphilus IPT5]|uniref:Uncharacterized protein n=1 Tax=Plenodomus tracheiphilus IPT5 TaxID=1408161 RepID=A0A6A7B2A5_9PLEO|nr:hypothetical protein T440DRAFT_533630 [Plenodomus tracheiphilus IPT5]
MSDQQSQGNMCPKSMEIDEVVAIYYSPSPGSPLGTGSHRPLKSTSATASYSFFQSRNPSPIYASSTSDPNDVNRPRLSRTNSGYLDRAQLFGRSPVPEFVSSPRLLSTAIEKRRRSSSLFTLEAATTKLNIDHVPIPPSQAFSRKCSSSSIEDEKDYTTLLNSRRQSARSLRSPRSNLTKTYYDEWIEAGTPDSAQASTQPSLGSGGTSDVPVARTIEESKPRTVSTAVAALRNQLFKGGLRPAPSDARKPSWTRRIFGGQTVASSKSPIATATAPLEDDPDEFGYENPTTPIENVRDILERVKSRSSSIAPEHEIAHSRKVLEQDKSCDDDDDRSGYSGVFSDLGTPPSPTLDASSMAGESGTTGPYITYQADQIYVQGRDTSDVASDVATAKESVSRSPDFAAVPIRAPESSKAILTLMTPVTNFSQDPLVFQGMSTTRQTGLETLGIMAPITIFSRVPISATEISTPPPNQAVSLSPSTHVRGQQLVSFSQACAITYGCVSFTAIYTAFRRVGEDQDTCKLVNDLGAALAVGIVLTVTTSLIGVDTIAISAKEILLAFGAALQAMFGMMEEWVGRYEQG